MIKNKKTFFLGIFIFLIPFLGLPNSWKTFLIIVSGLSLIWMSITIIIPRRGFAKRKVKREKVTAVFVESAPPPQHNDETTSL